MDAQLTVAELEDILADLGESPTDQGTLEMIVRRPAVDRREVLAQGELDVYDGLIGDNWRARGSSSTEDGSAHPDAQITLMNARVIQALSGDRSSWAMAGDQLYVDLDLSKENLQPGQRLAIGTAILEITSKPHRGCEKFMARFGRDALRFTSTEHGQELRRRGIYAKVVQGGTIREGDTISKI